MNRLSAAAGLTALSLAVAGCATAQPGTTAVAGSADGTVQCSYRPGGSPARPVDPPTGTDVPATGTATVTLSLGGHPITIELDRAAAPCTVHSFTSLAQQGYYTDTECHRLGTSGLFMLQCGDPTATGRGGPGYTFDDELERTSGYPAGSVAMANAGSDTNGSQFFLVFADTPLANNYTVFGRLDAASVAALGDIAEQGHDDAYGDGTGRPNAPTTITDVVSG